MLNRSDRPRDFAGDEGFAAPRTFMVEHDTVAGTKTVAFPIIDRRPIRKHLCHTVRTSRPERRLLVLRRLLDLTEHFAARSLKKTGTQAGFADCFQNADRAYDCDLGGVLINIAAHSKEALHTKMFVLMIRRPTR